MKTIGEHLKEKRISKRYSYKKVEKGTRIKEEFIKSLEEEEWEELPDYPVVLGFVKSLAAFLELDPEREAAILRRDYPPKSLPVNPKPDVVKRFSWSPRLTFIVGVAISLAVIFSYLGYQYISFIRPPLLEVISPEDGMRMSEMIVKVEGRTDNDATVVINNQPIIVNDGGEFMIDLAITKDTKEIVVVAKSRSGKESTIRRKIETDY